MARNKTPNQVLQARGSKHIRNDEPQARSGIVTPTMPLTNEGNRAFERICNELDSLGYLSPSYADMLTMAASAIGDIEIASADLMARGHISVTERGETKNPSWTIKTSAQMAAHRFLTALGLSPTSIGKLVGASAKEENEFEED